MKLFEKIKLERKSEVEIRLLGYPVLHYGKKTNKDGCEKYIDIFPKCFEHKILDKIMNKIDLTPYDHIWIVRTVGLGEAHLLNYFIDEFCKKYGAKKPCFISHREIYGSMFKLYSEIPFFSMNMKHDEYAPYFLKQHISYRGKVFHIFHCTLYQSIKYLESCKKNTAVIHAVNMIKTASDIETTTKQTVHFDDTIKSDTKRIISDIKLNKKFVFIAPEANTIDQLHSDFWKNLVKSLHKKNYDVFINTSAGTSAYGKSAKLSIAESMYLASKADYIISLRSGFSELLASLKKTISIIYSGKKQISASQIHKMYTLKKYPFYHSKIKEFIYETDNDQVISENLLEVLK